MPGGKPKYQIICARCGQARMAYRPTQQHCSRSCEARSERRRALNALNGKKGGRPRSRPSPEDRVKWQAYRSGFTSGKYHAWVRYRRLLQALQEAP